MIAGKFVDGNKPMVEATIASPSLKAVQIPYFVLDTGFTGDLAVTSLMAQELGLQVDGVQEMKTAENRLVSFPTANAIAVMGPDRLLVSVIIKEGLPLLGISFLEKFKYKAIVDCYKKTVEILAS